VPRYAFHAHGHYSGSTARTSNKGHQANINNPYEIPNVSDGINSQEAPPPLTSPT